MVARYKTACICFTLGIFLFSGSLYLLTLANASWAGPITPIGGLLLMVGWGSLFIARIKPFISNQRSSA